MIVLDGNIFGLQRYGGVSGYMARLACGLTDVGLSPSIAYPSRFLYEGFGRTLLPELPSVSQERISPRLAQYFAARVKGGEDIFHSAYYRIPSRSVKKYVVTVHDFTYERFRSGPAYWVHHQMKARAIAAADEIICVSQNTRDDLLEFFPKTTPETIKVIHHGVDTAEFFPQKADTDPYFGDFILFLGQRDGYKRFDLAVDVLARLPDFRLAIVGPQLTKQETALLSEKLGGRWHWFGQLGTVALRILYSSVHAFIYPSDYEGFGMPILEALACGCPVVASNLSCFPEVGGDSIQYASEQTPEAYIFHMEKLTNLPLRTQLRARGLNLSAEMSWINCVRQHLEVYTN